ncbi:MAG: 50S ribosomal protein L23 [Candidatus Aenigmarchaeota archaeon]|nr:50S ribosomal protein L23 [Candidatus Aenigmarchaeota archaeon]
MAEKKETKKEKKTEKKPAKAQKTKEEMKEVKYEGQPYETIKFVLMTEKAIRFIETHNRLMFVVDRKADRQEIRKAVEAAFKTKISDVNVLIDQKGRKRAFVKFEKPGEAGEIAIRLGII